MNIKEDIVCRRRDSNYESQELEATTLPIVPQWLTKKMFRFNNSHLNTR